MGIYFYKIMDTRFRGHDKVLSIKNNMIDEILNRLENSSFVKDDLIFLLESDNTLPIYKKADRIRKEYVGDEVHLRGIIEFSNYCKRECLYCGLQNQNRNIDRYRLSPKEIVQIAIKSKHLNYKTIVLQSGEDDYYADDMICEIVEGIKKLGYAVTLSIGEKTYEQYKKYRESGADRFLLKHETSDEKLYKKLNPGMTLKNRLRCHVDLKKLGYQIGSGIMIGLPEQSLNSIAEDILLFQKMNYDMIGISPFIPNNDTILKDILLITPKMIKKVVAITRIILKDIHLPVTTAFSTINNSTGIEEMLTAGANVIMPNVTPIEYKEKYKLYPNEEKTKNEINDYHTKLLKRLNAINRAVSKGYGHRIKNKRSIR